jgi:hypothetical protein
VIGSFRLTRNGLLRQTANRTANIPPATIRENLRFAASDHLLAVLPDFPAERLWDCHLGIKIAGNPSKVGFLARPVIGEVQFLLKRPVYRVTAILPQMSP